MSDEYIKKEDAIKSIADHDEFKGERWIKEAWADYLIEDAKPADVAPVRHAKWLSKAMRIMCSDCGAEFNDEIVYMLNNYEPMNYCPACGAKMDGGDTDA